MQFHYPDMKRANRTVERLLLNVEGLPLEVAREWTAALYGHPGWIPLNNAVRNFKGPATPDDEDVDYETYDKRFRAQVRILKDISGFDSLEVTELVRRLSPTSLKGQQRLSREDESKLLFPRAFDLSEGLEELAKLIPEVKSLLVPKAHSTVKKYRKYGPTLAAMPFFSAIAKNQSDLACDILRSEPSFANAISEKGSTPLLDAINVGDKALFNLLIAAKADPNTCDLEGFTPLHDSAKQGFVWACKSLLEEGANPNATTNMGWPPLLTVLTTRYGDAPPRDFEKCIELLLDYGADRFQENFVGMSAHGISGQLDNLPVSLRKRLAAPR